MHEFSIAQSMLETIGERLGGPTELVTATMTIGALSGVNADALRFCFAEVADEMGFGRPQLVINEAPARMHCNACNTEYATSDVAQPCPQCGSFERMVLGGMECTIDEVEIEEKSNG